jgi:hypothetical protein
MICYEVVLKVASQGLKLRLPRMTEEEVRRLLNVDTREGVYEKIERLNDTELLRVFSVSACFLNAQSRSKDSVMVTQSFVCLDQSK